MKKSYPCVLIVLSLIIIVATFLEMWKINQVHANYQIGVLGLICFIQTGTLKENLHRKREHL